MQLVTCGFREDIRDLYITVLARLLAVERVLNISERLSIQRGLDVLPRLRIFKFHGVPLPKISVALDYTVKSTRTKTLCPLSSIR